jgi:hypothetical protein
MPGIPAAISEHGAVLSRESGVGERKSSRQHRSNTDLFFPVVDKKPAATATVCTDLQSLLVSKREEPGDGEQQQDAEIRCGA